MISKQFLETNQKNMRAVFLQQRNLRKKTQILIKRKKVNDSNQMQLSLKIQATKILQKKSKQVKLMKREFSTRQTTRSPEQNQNREFFFSKDQKKERKISLCLKPIKKDISLHETIDSESEKNHRRNFLENLLSQNKNQSLFLKNRKEMLMAGKRSHSDFASQSSARVINLPQSLMLKTHLSSPQCLDFDKIQQNHSVQSIHSRKGMRSQQQRFRKRKILSQHSFRQAMEVCFDLKEKGKQTLQKNWFKQKISKEMDDLPIGIERIDLKQKPKKKDEYVNIFYENRTLKPKAMKDELYTPWRRHMMNKRDFDLSELLQIHH